MFGSVKSKGTVLFGWGLTAIVFGLLFVTVHNDDWYQPQKTSGKIQIQQQWQIDMASQEYRDAVAAHHTEADRLGLSYNEYMNRLLVKEKIEEERHMQQWLKEGQEEFDRCIRSWECRKSLLKTDKEHVEDRIEELEDRVEELEREE